MQAILGATQRSFAAMKRRLGSKHTTGIFYMERPFFNVDVELKVITGVVGPFAAYACSARCDHQ